MIKVKILNTPDLIEDACALLYDTYIRHIQWKFEPDNPSALRVEAHNGRNLLIDRFTDKALWFGAFDGKNLVGCGRLTNLDERNKFEIEGYPSSNVIIGSLHKENGLELGKITAMGSYEKKKVLHHLFLFAFEYCFDNKCSIFGATHNPYVKSIFTQVQFPLKRERAFKYEPQDPQEVNFYYASYKNKEVIEVIKNLRHILYYLNNNVTKELKEFTILDALEMVAPICPALFYWHDRDGVVLGINESCLKAIGGVREQIVGHTPYDFYPKEVAEYILKHNELVMRTGEVLSQEETINNLTTGEILHGLSIKAPLYDKDGVVIGVIGTTIDITAQKEAERLKLENANYQAERKAQEKLLEVMDNIVSVIQSYKVNILDDKLGINNNTPYYQMQYVRLSKREEQGLYLLSLGKSPKDIARILGKLENKTISPKTVSGVINKQLYLKLEANNYSSLIEKATKLNLIRFMPKSLVKSDVNINFDEL
ncbi:MAG: PAS domain-containing protein [Neisseriaceae bacterium]